MTSTHMGSHTSEHTSLHTSAHTRAQTSVWAWQRCNAERGKGSPNESLNANGVCRAAPGYARDYE